jgi:5'-nucleotidase (lipoprotein e(P4) family)
MLYSSRAPLIAFCSTALLSMGACTAKIKVSGKTRASESQTLSANLSPSDNLNAVLYQQTAAEYQANSLQSFRLAQQSLEALLKLPNLTAAVEQTGDFSRLPPAVIVDVDETMLDNSAYQARLVKDNTVFNDATWNAWVNERAALPIAGATEFSHFASARRVRVIYLSNRDVSTTEATRANLEAVGFADATTTANFLFRDKANGLDTKGQRRALVAQKYRILMLIGDNLGDFHEGYKSSLDARKALYNQFADYWGSRWIMIANPTYGSWEQAISNFDNALVPAEIREKKLESLRLQLPKNTGN